MFPIKSALVIWLFSVSRQILRSIDIRAILLNSVCERWIGIAEIVQLQKLFEMIPKLNLLYQFGRSTWWCKYGFEWKNEQKLKTTEMKIACFQSYMHPLEINKIHTLRDLKNETPTYNGGWMPSTQFQKLSENFQIEFSGN